MVTGAQAYQGNRSSSLSLSGERSETIHINVVNATQKGAKDERFKVWERYGDYFSIPTCHLIFFQKD